MTKIHQANIDLIADLPDRIPQNLEEARDRFAGDFEWYYFNKSLPQINKTYKGFDGLMTFFDDLGALTGGSFRVSLKEIYSLGSEFVVVHACPAMRIDEMALETDAVVVWRIVEGKIAEAWDVPGINSAIRPQPQA